MKNNKSIVLIVLSLKSSTTLELATMTFLTPDFVEETLKEFLEAGLIKKCGYTKNVYQLTKEGRKLV